MSVGPLKETNPPSLWCCPRVTYESQRFNSIPWWLSCAQQSVTTFHSAALTLLRSRRGSLTLTELTSSSRRRYFIQALMWARWETAVTGARGYLSSCYQSWQSELRICVCVCVIAGGPEGATDIHCMAIIRQINCSNQCHHYSLFQYGEQSDLIMYGQFQYARQYVTVKCAPQ